MQQFKTIIGIFTTLLFSILTVTAQDFDPKQGYEIHTVSGLALDNQEVYTQRELEKEMSSPDLILSLVFSKDAFILYAQDVPFRLPYEQADGITDESIKKLLRNFSSTQFFSRRYHAFIQFFHFFIQCTAYTIDYCTIRECINRIYAKKTPFPRNAEDGTDSSRDSGAVLQLVEWIRHLSDGTG